MAVLYCFLNSEVGKEMLIVIIIGLVKRLSSQEMIHDPLDTNDMCGLRNSIFEEDEEEKNCNCHSIMTITHLFSLKLIDNNES